MNKSILKSTGAILAGFVLSAILSVGMDSLLEKRGIMQMENFKQAPLLVVCMVIFYRFMFNVVGCYLTAKLAPSNPMKHALIIGVIGTVLSILGAFTMWDMAKPFYNISVILISLPSAWLGGQLFLNNQNGQKNAKSNN